MRLKTCVKIVKECGQKWRDQFVDQEELARRALRRCVSSPPTPFEETTRFLIGRKVEEEIARTGDKSRKGVVAARHAVARTSRLEYGTVDQYHNAYVRRLKSTPTVPSGAKKGAK
jgi:hypothetical protein